MTAVLETQAVRKVFRSGDGSLLEVLNHVDLKVLRGEVVAVTVDRIGHDPALIGDVPYVVAIVALEEGPRMPARIIDCDVDDSDRLRPGLQVEACYESIDDVTLVRFRPRKGEA